MTDCVRQGEDRLIGLLTSRQPGLRTPAITIFLSLIFLAWLSSPLTAQSVSISLASGNGTPGSAVPLAISMTATGGAQPSSLEWTMRYPADVTSVVVSGGPKNVTGSNFGGQSPCLLFDLPQKPFRG